MFTPKHYINSFSLLSTALISSYFIRQVYPAASFLIPLLFFFIYVAAIIISANYLKGITDTSVRIIMFLLSPVFYYLLLAEYGLLLNIVFLLLLLLVSEKYVDTDKTDLRFFILAFLFGLILYINLNILIVYISYILYFYRSSIKKLVSSIIISASILLILFYSGLLERETYSSAYRINLLLIYLPLWAKLFMLIICLYTGWIVADIQEVLFSGGILLFLAVILFMITGPKIMPWSIITLFSMSALSFSAVLLMLSVKSYRVDRYLGKLLPLEKQK